jgi:hypothetical protein
MAIASFAAYSALGLRGQGTTRVSPWRDEAVKAPTVVPEATPGEAAMGTTEVEGQPTGTCNAREALTIPAGTVRAVRNVTSGNAAELATYVVEKGKPVITAVE